MSTRTLAPLTAAVALLVSTLCPALPVAASRPSTVDPAKLALSQSALPAGAVVVHSGVSDNADADGAPSPDGYNNDIRQLHQQHYAALGRITGYRERFHFALQPSAAQDQSSSGVQVTTQYLASVFGSSQQARAALDDATGPGSLIALIGSPLTPQCAAGEACAAFSGINGSSTILYMGAVRGPALVEFASAVDTTAWHQAPVAAAVQSALYAVLAAADAQVQAALGASGGTTPTPGTPSPTPTPTPTAAAIAVPPLQLGSSYVALGDSYAAGYLTEDMPIDTPCRAPDAPGFVCVFWRYLKEINPQQQLNNLAEPGADSCELAGAGHRCYDDVRRANPVDAAVQFLQAHPGQVSPITLTIGGNDLLALLSQALKDPSGTIALLPGIYKRYRANLDTILSKLRTAAPGAAIIVTTQPNPFGGLGSPPLPAGLPDLAVTALRPLNNLMKDEAPKYGAIIADSAAAFDAYPGGGSALSWVPIYLPKGRIEIHPTPQGYKVYGEALIKASGYLLSVKAGLARKQVRAGTSDRVTGTTGPDLTVHIQIWIPHHAARRVSTAASATGTFARSFKVGKAHGKGHVQVCVEDADMHSACTGKMTFTVR